MRGRTELSTPVADATPWQCFRKKLVEVRAYQFTQAMGENYILDGVPLPEGVKLGGASYHPERREITDSHFVVRTMHGDNATVKAGDWIVPEPVADHYYPVDPAVFSRTYDLADGSASDQEKSVAPAPSEQETRSELLKANLLNSRLYEALKESKALYILGAAVNGRHGEKSIEKADRIYKLIDEALSQAERGRGADVAVERSTPVSLRATHPQKGEA